MYVKDTASGQVTLAPCAGCAFDNTAGGTYNLTDNNATSIVTASGETVTAGTLNVTDTAGTIGTSCSSPFVSNTASLTATAGVSAFISDSSTAITVSNTTVGTSTGDEFFLEGTSTTAGVIATGGTGITGTSGGIAPVVVLVSDAGSIGTSTNSVLVNAAQLTMQASTSGQNVYVNDMASGQVTLAPCAGCAFDNTAGGAYNLTDNNATSIVTASGETVTAGTLNVTDTLGTIGTSCSSPFASDTASLTATAGVSAFFSDSYSSTTTKPITVSNTTVGTAAADEFFLEATSGTAGLISTSGTGITGTSGATAGVVVGQRCRINWSSSAAVTVNAAQLTMQAKASGQNVYVVDTAGGSSSTFLALGASATVRRLPLRANAHARLHRNLADL